MLAKEAKAAYSGGDTRWCMLRGHTLAKQSLAMMGQCLEIGALRRPFRTLERESAVVIDRRTRPLHLFLSSNATFERTWNCK